MTVLQRLTTLTKQPGWSRNDGDHLPCSADYLDCRILSLLRVRVGGLDLLLRTRLEAVLLAMLLWRLHCGRPSCRLGGHIYDTFGLAN